MKIIQKIKHFFKKLFSKFKKKKVNFELKPSIQQPSSPSYKLLGYFRVSLDFLKSKFNKTELAINKFQTRPFVCFEFDANQVIAVPVYTTHNFARFWKNNIYICDRKYHLDIPKSFIVDKYSITPWSAPTKQYYDEINAKLSRVKEILTDIYQNISNSNLK